MKAFACLTLVLLAIRTAAAAPLLFNDDFNGAIDSAWNIVRHDAAFYTVGSTALDLRASSGDLIAGRNDAKNTFLIDNPTTGDFVVTLKLDSFTPSASSTPQVVLVAYDDDDNYLRGGYSSASGSTATQVVIEVGGGFTVLQQAASYPGSFIMELRKVGNTYTHLFSTDGVNFTQYNPAATYGDGTPAKLGFVVMDDPAQSTHAVIDQFTVSVPEPSTSLLLGMAALGFAFRPPVSRPRLPVS
jgi:hypothetical protein